MADLHRQHLMADVPPPVLFNPWKHHCRFLQAQIHGAAAAGEEALRELAGQIVVLGHELMDLYVGPLTPFAIAEFVIAELGNSGRLEREAFRTWLDQGGGYQVLTHPESSRWVLRAGEVGARYVHVHPGRWTPLTRRVRANVLKTAVMVTACAAARGTDGSVQFVNEVRQKYLGLPPVAGLEEGRGLWSVIELLKSGDG